MKIEGKVIAETDVKRFYLPGIKLIHQCPECEEEQIWNGSSDYLSYPYIGKPIDFDFYCQHCDHEWTHRILLDLSVKEVF